MNRFSVFSVTIVAFIAIICMVQAGEKDDAMKAKWHELKNKTCAAPKEKQIAAETECCMMHKIMGKKIAEECKTQNFGPPEKRIERMCQKQPDGGEKGDKKPEGDKGAKMKEMREKMKKCGEEKGAGDQIKKFEAATDEDKAKMMDEVFKCKNEKLA